MILSENGTVDSPLAVRVVESRAKEEREVIRKERERGSEPLM